MRGRRACPLSARARRSAPGCHCPPIPSSSPTGCRAQGKDAAREFYGFLTANFRTEVEQPLHQVVTDDALVLEQRMTGTVIGEMLGIPGNGRTVSFRILHVFEFRGGLVSREQVWIDSAAIVEQLTAP